MAVNENDRLINKRLEDEDVSLHQIIDGMARDLEKRSELIEKEMKRSNLDSRMKNRYEKELKKIGKLRANLSALKTKLNLAHKGKFVLSKQQNEEIYLNLQSVLPRDIFNELSKLILSDINKYNKSKKEGIVSLEEIKNSLIEIEKNIRECGLNNKHFWTLKFESRYLGDQQPEEKKSTEHIYKKAIKKLKGTIKQYYTEDSIFYKFSKPKEIKLSKELEEIDKIFKLSNNQKNGQVSYLPYFWTDGQDEKWQLIYYNFEDIKKAYLSKEKLSYTKDSIDKLIELFEQEKCDFSKTISYLKNLKKETEIEFQKLEKFLNKFDFDHLSQLFIKNEEKRNHDERIRTYSTLAYQVQDAKANGNSAMVRKLEDDMREVARLGNIDESEMKAITAEAQIKYLSDASSEKLDQTVREETQKRPDYDGIAREYIRYVASLKNKEEALSYSEYSSQRHNVAANELMVSKELREELRGKKK